MSATVDASVWVAADAEDEVGRPDARALLRAIASSGEVLHQPTLTLVEVPAALRRRFGNDRAAAIGAARLSQLPGVTFHGLDLAAAAEAARLATQTALRGADAIYLATAAATGSTLITFDTELRAKAPPAISVMTPAEWVASRA